MTYTEIIIGIVAFIVGLIVGVVYMTIRIERRTYKPNKEIHDESGKWREEAVTYMKENWKPKRTESSEPNNY